ncbi:hypothetical protein FGG08_001717 [Glutinoglossum americanum]|uniref:DNA replication regulator Sld3 C-terminal domain-containing protein n=1 Tax=Glutinoglossum americanum TaxID=1670608 RepID=A0A9P8L543_9PEZI|nr:hypothetical protein FGG08_001717 [Glutinoglossum americanum]
MGGVSLAHAIDQTRPACNDAAPPQDASIGIFDAPASRKRKRASSIGELLVEPFVIRPHPGSIPNTPQILEPILIIPRSHLPLSYLDYAAGSTTIPTARLFSAHIKKLESRILGDGVGKDPVVLIARAETDRSLYAIEWVSKGIYALCGLGGWVREEALLGATLCPRDGSLPAIMDHGTAAKDSMWWMIARVNPLLPSAVESQSKRADTKGAPAVLLSMKHGKPIVPFEPPYLQENSGSGSQGDQPKGIAITQSPEPMESPAATGQSAQQIFDMIRTQYLETLYISKASLAYFPKGPLSRARAVFSADHGTSMLQNDLVTFLRSLVLSLSLVDKKYKNSIPEFLGSLPALNFSEDDVDALVTKGRKKRRSKMKPGKDGLYPGEDYYLRKWWMDRQSDHSMALSGERESNAGQIKRRIANLRTRETELQIILILEIFTLQESSQSKGQNEDRKKHNAEIPRREKGEKAKKKSNKNPNLALVLDLLVDRLCIWQSVSSEDGATAALGKEGLGDSKASDPDNTVIGSPNTKNLEAKSNDDHLRDFYNEVIMPFYAARLPEHCNTVSRKLGGLTGSSSIRLPLAKATRSKKTSSRPGDAVKRVAPRSRKTLERVLTEEKKARSISRGPSIPPTLAHSAAASVVPGLKRETKECSLWTVPTKDSQPPMNVCRGGVLKSKRFSQREIDMSFTTIATNATSAKLQRRAKVEEELKEAITALKKPNRGLAIKEFVETSERRALSSSSLGRGKKLVKNTLNVQVMATPKGNRKTGVVSMTPPVYQNRPQPLGEQKPTPGTKGHHVPQSITRPYQAPQPPGERLPVSQSIEQPMRHTLQPSVQDTPSRVRSRGEEHMLGRNTESVVGVMDNLPQLPVFRCQKSEVSHLEFEDLDRFWRNDLKKPATEAAMEIQRTPFMSAGNSVWAVAEVGFQGTPLKSVESNSRTMIGVGVQETPIKGTKRVEAGEALSTGRDASIYEALGWDEVDDLA